MPASHDNGSTSSSLSTVGPGDSTPADSTTNNPSFPPSPTHYRRALRIAQGGISVVQLDHSGLSAAVGQADPAPSGTREEAREPGSVAVEAPSQPSLPLPTTPGRSATGDESDEHGTTTATATATTNGRRQVVSRNHFLQRTQASPRRPREGAHEEILDRWDNREVGQQRTGFPTSISRIRRAAALLARTGTVTQQPLRSNNNNLSSGSSGSSSGGNGNLRDGGAREQERSQERFRVAPYTPSWTRTSRSHENLSEANRRNHRGRLDTLVAQGSIRTGRRRMDAEDHDRDSASLTREYEYPGWAPGTTTAASTSTTANDAPDHSQTSHPSRNTPGRRQSLQPVIGSSSMVRSSSGTTSLERRYMAERQRLHDRMAQEQEPAPEHREAEGGWHTYGPRSQFHDRLPSGAADVTDNPASAGTVADVSPSRPTNPSPYQPYDWRATASRIQRIGDFSSALGSQQRTERAPTSETYTQLSEQHERERFAHLARVQAEYRDEARAMIQQQAAAAAAAAANGGSLTQLQRHDRYEAMLQEQERQRQEMQRPERVVRLDRQQRAFFRTERLRRAGANTTEGGNGNGSINNNGGDLPHVASRTQPFNEMRRNLYDLHPDLHANHNSPNSSYQETSRKGVEKAIRYLHRIHNADSFDDRKDRIRAAEEEGLAGLVSAGGALEDFILDPRVLDALPETSWLMPGTTFSGSQRAVMPKPITSILPQYTSTTRERYSRVGASSDPLDNENLRSSPPSHTRQRDLHPYGNYTNQSLVESAARSSIERIRANRGIDSLWADRSGVSANETSRPSNLGGGSTNGIHRSEENEDTWPVKVTITSIDYRSMTLTGTMEAMNLPNKNGSVGLSFAPAIPPPPPQPRSSGDKNGTDNKINNTITTFLEGEIIDLQQHSLETRDYKADSSIDSTYWRRLEPFKSLGDADIAAKMLSTSWLQDTIGREYVLMRWKEKCFVTPSDADMGLTICGFYYISLHRQTGRIEGLYYDPKSSPYQHLCLRPEPTMNFATYTFQ